MTHPNVELMRRYVEATNSGDARTALAYFAPDMRLHIGGRSPHAGTYHGPEGYLDYYTRVHQDTDGGLEVLELHDVLANDHHGVLLVKERFNRHGRSVESNRVVVYELRDGAIVEIWAYDSDPYAYDALFADVAPLSAGGDSAPSAR